MAPIASRQAAQIVENATRVVAIELQTASQSLYMVKPALRPGRRVGEALDLARRLAPPLETDRSTSRDIETLTGLVRSGELGRVLVGA